MDSDLYHSAFFLGLKLQAAVLLLTYFSNFLLRKNQKLPAEVLTNPSDTDEAFIELLISVYLSLLVLCLITNDKWMRSIPPNKWSEAHFNVGISS